MKKIITFVFPIFLFLFTACDLFYTDVTGYLEDNIKKIENSKIAPSISYIDGIGTEKIVTITHPENSASIYYTTDGSTPYSGSATHYENPFSIDVGANKKTVNAIAYIENITTPIAEKEISLYGKCAAPTINVNPTFTTNTQATITCSTSGAKIQYKINNEKPFIYTTPVVISNTSTIYAYATHPNYTDSDTVQASTTELFTVTFNANDGAIPATPDKTQTFTDLIAQNLTANTFTRADYNFSSWNTQADGKGDTYVNGANFTATDSITLYAQWTAWDQVTTPVIATDGAIDTATGKKTITLSTQTPGATIYYTKDGTDPDTAIGGSTKEYNGAFEIDISTGPGTVKAIATKQGMTKSLIAEEDFAQYFPTTIYLDGTSGSNSYNGFTATSPVLTMTDAMDKLAKNGDCTIWIMGTTDIASNIEWKKETQTSLTLKRYDGTSGGSAHTGAFANVTRGGTLSLTNITLDGQGGQKAPDGSTLEGSTLASSAMITVAENGTLVIGTGAVLQNNKNTSTSNHGGAVCSIGHSNTTNSAIITMTDGSIQSNSAVQKGGGVYAAAGTTFTMNNGTITSNTVTSEYDADKLYGGGGIYATGNNTELTISGSALITKNTTQNFGGGIRFNTGTMTINGGTIKQNIGKHGGGVMVDDAKTFDMLSGSIISNTATHNTAEATGGGIYAKADMELNISGGSILSNTAKTSGGGIYLPTVGQTLNVKTLPNINTNVIGGTISEDGSLTGGTPNNIRFVNSTTSTSIKLTGTLNDGASIGLSPKDPTAGVMLVEGTSPVTVGNKGYFTLDSEPKDTYIDSDNLHYGTAPAAVTEVYLDGTVSSGGTGTVASPFNNFADAKTALPNGGIIWVTGTIESIATEIWQSEIDNPITIKRNTGFNDTLINVANNTLTLKNITIDGNKANVTTANEALVSVNRAGLVLENGAILQNNKHCGINLFSSTVTMKTGSSITDNENNGVYVSTSGSGPESTFTMENGTISENSGSTGGGVLLQGNTSYKANFIMEDGTISSNTSSGDGGAVNIAANASFTMNGGEIIKNSAGNGGAVLIEKDGTLTMTGGTIGGSEADKNYTSTPSSGNAFGGGVLVKGTFNMQGGEISYNTVSGAATNAGKGGGIYIWKESSSYGTLKLEGNVIINNSENQNSDGSNIEYGYSNDLNRGKVHISGALNGSDNTIGITAHNIADNTIIATVDASVTDISEITLDNNGTKNLAINGTNIIISPYTEEGFTISGNTITEYNGTETNVKIPPTIGGVQVESIEKDAFNGNENITSVTLPDSVNTIDEQAFKDCSLLTSVILGNGVPTIKKQTFEGCSSLSYVSIGSSVTTIEEEAFKNCDAIDTLIIPDNVTTIPSKAFEGCTYITFYSEPNSEPGGWSVNWDNNGTQARPVVWDCTLSDGTTEQPYVISVTKSINSIENIDDTRHIKAPFRNGYTFAGWSSTSGGSVLDGGNVEYLEAATDATYYTIWTKN